MREQAIDLRLDLRNALFPLNEQDQIIAHLREAETLAEALNDHRRLGQTYTYMASYFWVTGNHEDAVTYGQNALASATALGDIRLRVMANYRLGQSYYFLGDYRQAINHLRRNVDALDEVVDDVDVSLNSELSVLAGLSDAAQRRGRVHPVIVMVDLGDLREGVWPDELPAFVRDAAKLAGVRIVGLGANLTCYGGVAPTRENMAQLVDCAEQMEALSNARGIAFDRLFLEGMIQHHQGAIDMVETLFNSPGAAQESTIFKFAEDVDADQQMEIDRMRAVLKQLR